MRTVAALVVIALACAGCIGSSGASSAPGSGHNEAMVVPPKPQPKTEMTIIYTTTATCPPGALCPTKPDKHKFLIVRRHLTCSPPGGNYPDPAAACRALADIATKLDHNTNSPGVCSCPGFPAGYVSGRAFGYYDGKRRTIPLNYCALCGLPINPTDLDVLLPGESG